MQATNNLIDINFLTFKIIENPHQINETEWNEILEVKKTFLKLQFLKIIYDQKFSHISYKFVKVYYQAEFIGVVYFQITTYSFNYFINYLKQKNDKRFRCIVFKTLAKLLYPLRQITLLKLVTCGNNFVSGENAFQFKPEYKQSESLIIYKLLTHIKVKCAFFSATLIKDFYTDYFNINSNACILQTTKLDIEPNLLVQIPTNVNTIKEYINLFSKKYRNRAKQIIKKGELLTKKRLTVKQVDQYQNELFDLYSQLAQKSKYHFFTFNKNYFNDVLKAFSENFHIDAWFYNDQMVSFASGFYSDNKIETHYIGLNYKLNTELELYQNILYNYVEEAILTHKSEVSLGRTATEIKTTLGAQVQPLYCYLIPQNICSKMFLKPFSKLFKPRSYVARHPFKQEN